MKFDLLVGGNGDVIGIAVAEAITVDEFAAQIGADENQVHVDWFVERNGMLVANPNGTAYTYWSKQGRLQMARLAQLSSVADEQVFFFERYGKIEAFRSIEEAAEAGYEISECTKEMNKAAVMILAATGSQDPYVLAYEKSLEPYM